MINYLYSILASLVYGIEPTIRQLIIANGPNAPETLVISFFFGLIYTFIISKIRKHKIIFGNWRQMGKLLLYCSIGGGLCLCLLVSSYQFIPVGCATVFHFIYPVVVCLAISYIEKTKITKYKIFAICLLISGILLLSNGIQGASVTGITLAILSGLAYAAYVVLMDKTFAKALPNDIREFYLNFGGLLISFIYLTLDECKNSTTY